MNKKLLFMGLCAAGLLGAAPALEAQTGMQSGSISAILEDNSLRDTFLRYTSVLSYFFPEEATRLGFTAGNHLLNDRTAQTDDQALQAFKAVEASLQQIDIKTLSASRQAEYTLLSDTLQRQLFLLNQNRIARDPLYYAQALDAVYDLTLAEPDDSRKQRTDLLGRVSALPKVARQAQENLTQAPPQLARMAMEKAYFAYLAFDEVADRITKGAALSNDPRDVAMAETTVRQAKASVRQLFDLFKNLSQQDSVLADDVRVGDEHYYSFLQEVYQIDDKPALLTKNLDQALDKAQHRLFNKLLPFQLSAEEEEITVVEGLNEVPQTTVAPKPKANKKPAKPVYSAPTANQFYAIANQLESPFALDKVLQEFTKQSAALSSRLLQNKALLATVPLTIRPLGRYFSYQHPFFMVPAYGVFWLRLPQGNQLAQEELLKRDYNEPAYKLLISQQVVPGHYYQSQMIKNNVRRLLGSPTLDNGWRLYALGVADQQGYFVTDEEQLFLAWQHYLYALAAVVDQRLHTRQYTYEEALAFLTATHGFTHEDATALLNPILANPGQAVSFVWGANLLEKAAAPYMKKAKNGGKAMELLLQVGNVSPDELTQELKRVAKK